MNLTGKINLMRLEHTGVITINGKSGAKVCVVIPVEENDIYISVDEQTGRAKGAYLGLNLYENQSESGLDQYGNSHAVKQSLSKQFRETMTEEELKAKPFLGNMKPMEQVNRTSMLSTTVADVENNDDLPF